MRDETRERFVALGDEDKKLYAEKRLMFAVLEEAVGTYQKYIFQRSQEKHALFQEARKWIFSDNRDWLFSFLDICEHLDLDPDHLRKGLQRWMETKITEAEAQIVRKIRRSADW